MEEQTTQYPTSNEEQNHQPIGEPSQGSSGNQDQGSQGSQGDDSQGQGDSGDETDAK